MAEAVTVMVFAASASRTVRPQTQLEELDEFGTGDAVVGMIAPVRVAQKPALIHEVQ